MDNLIKSSSSKPLDCGKVVVIKSHQGFNESNLMCLPIFSLKREKVGVMERIWYRGNEEVGLTVKGSADNGVPTVKDMDVLMALFRIMAKSVGNSIMISDENKAQNIPKVINFTYRKLGEEMGLKGFGKQTKERLEKSIKTLTEATIYSKLSLRNQVEGDYVVDFNGEESCRILKNYRGYSKEKRKLMKQDLLHHSKIEEMQSIEIDDFFFNNMCNNYFKLYDYDKYMKLTQGIAKKLLLILTTWSHGYEKYLNIKTIYDYVGLEVNTSQDEYYYNKQIKKALEELKSIGFIQDFDFSKDKGVLFIFNTKVKNNKLRLSRYTKIEEIIDRFSEIGLLIEDWNDHLRLDTTSYVAALLRYTDDKVSRNEIRDVKKFVLKGLPYESYDVKKYMVEL